MRRHMVSLAIVTLVVAGAVVFVAETPASSPAHPPASRPAAAAPASGATGSPATAAPAAPAASRPAPGPAVPRTVAEGRAVLAHLSPGERAELAPLARAFEAAARAAAAPRRAPAAQGDDGGDPRYPVSRDGIQAAVRASVPELEACYLPWLGLNPQAGGRLVTTFHIGAPGKGGDPAVARITEVKVAKGGLGNRFLEGCILSVLSGLRFQPPKDPQGVTVNYPMRFAATKDAAAPHPAKTAP